VRSIAKHQTQGPLTVKQTLDLVGGDQTENAIHGAGTTFHLKIQLSRSQRNARRDP